MKTRSKMRLLLPLIPAAALGIVELATKVTVAAHVAGIGDAPERQSCRATNSCEQVM